MTEREREGRRERYKQPVRERDGNNESRDKAGGLGNCLGNIMNEPGFV